MTSNNLTINKQKNKLIYLIDSALDKFVKIVLTIIRLLVPQKYANRLYSIVEHSEMLHNVIGLTFFNAIGGFCVIATQIKLANYLGASMYGVYSYCLAIGEVGAMIVRYGRHKTMLRDLVQNEEKRESIIVGTFNMSLINLLVFMLVIMIFHNQFDISINLATILLIISPCLISFDPSPVYESLRLMSWHSIYALLQKFGFLIIIWLLFIIGYNVSLLSIGFLMAASWILIIVMQIVEISRNLNINYLRPAGLAQLKSVYKENFSVFLSCAFGVAFGPILSMMLNKYSNSTALGIYSAGLHIYNICWFLNTQIARVGNPMMAEAGRADVDMTRRRALVRNYLLIMVIASLPFAIPLLFFSGTLTSLLYTSEYSTLSNYLPIMGIYLLCAAIGVVFEQFLISLRKDKTYFMIYILSAIATFICAFIMLPRYGTLGAFVSLCVPRGVGYIFYLIFSVPLLKKN